MEEENVTEFYKMMNEHFDEKLYMPSDGRCRMGYLAALADTLNFYLPKESADRDVLEENMLEGIKEWYPRKK